MLKVDIQTFALKLTTENTFMFTSNFYKLTVAQWVDPFCYIFRYIYDQNRTGSCQSIQT